MATNNAINSQNPIQVAKGGTGNASATEYAVQCGGTTSTGAHQSIASVGTSGQVLTSNGAGALPTFQAAASGALVLIGTADASNSATISFTGLTTYPCMVVIIRALNPVSSGAILQMTVSIDGSTYLSTGYFSGLNSHPYNSTTLTNANSTSVVRLSTGLSIVGNYCAQLAIEQLNVAAGVIVNGASTYIDSSVVVQTAEIGALTPNGITAVRFTMSTGNISSGHFALYGLVSS